MAAALAAMAPPIGLTERLVEPAGAAAVRVTWVGTGKGSTEPDGRLTVVGRTASVVAPAEAPVVAETLLTTHSGCTVALDTSDVLAVVRMGAGTGSTVRLVDPAGASAASLVTVPPKM